MTLFTELLARLRALFRRNATVDDIREELQFHVEMRTDELARRGVDAGVARRAALKRFGSIAVIQDRAYDERGGGAMETVLQDVRYAWRRLRLDPAFTILTVLILAAGIGLSTALFSVIDAAFLRPLPYPHPEELITVEVQQVDMKGGTGRYGPSVADIRRWRSVPSVVAHAGMGRVAVSISPIIDSGVPQRLVVAAVSDDFLETYGIVPILGRSILADDTRFNAPPVALLGHAFWQRAFSGDPSVLGRSIRIQDKAVTIVGVLPAGFFDKTAVWQARQFNESFLDFRGSGTPVIARLQPGVTLEQAAGTLNAVTAPGQIAGGLAHVYLRSMYDDETTDYKSTARALSLAVAFIVTIACVNVAGLLLARGSTRQAELAIRASIGAGRGRLVRQLLTESLVLGAAGAVVGVLIAYVSLDSLLTIVPLSLPPNSPAAVNGTVLALTLALSVITSVLFGLFPALRQSRQSVTMTSALANGARAGATAMSKRSGQWLIGVEVALALVLISASALVVRSFSRLVAVDLGYDATDVLVQEVEPVDQSPAIRNDYYPALAATVRQLPEVAYAGAIDPLALRGGGTYLFPKADTGVDIEGPQRVVLPGFFETMSVRPIAGRLLEDADLSAGEAALIDVAGAQKFFGGDAVGHTLSKASRTWRIVGVVPAIRLSGPDDRLMPQMFVLPERASDSKGSRALAIVLRLRPGALLGVDQLKRAAEAIGPRVVIGQTLLASDLLSDQVARPRHRMQLVGLLGMLGFLLTLVGIFCVTAYAVARRTREIGVRVAFGASPAQVVAMVVRDAAWPIIGGLVVGVAGSYYTAQIIAGTLFQTPPRDPATLAAAVALLALASGIAAWFPARRAASVDPVAALRTP